MMFSMSDLHFIVVLYNKSCSDSVTCSYLLKQNSKGLHITIIDNSTKDYSNHSFCENNGWDYISMNGNAGLSRAYNMALEVLKTDSGYVIWCDDDSEFAENYVESVLKYINKYHENYRVFAPLVYAGDKIYSPDCIGKDGFIFRLKSIDDLDPERISAINSGLVVDLTVYQNYRYDTSMFLDYIDHDFSLFCLKNGIKIKFMKHSVIHQNSFFEGTPSPEKLKMRRKIYKNDFLRFVKRNNLNMLKGYKKYYNGKILQMIKQLQKG